jgi:hypothetical protein
VVRVGESILLLWRIPGEVAELVAADRMADRVVAEEEADRAAVGADIRVVGRRRDRLEVAVVVAGIIELVWNWDSPQRKSREGMRGRGEEEKSKDNDEARRCAEGRREFGVDVRPLAEKRNSRENPHPENSGHPVWI